MLAAPKPISTPVGSRHCPKFHTFFQIPNIYALFQFMLISFICVFFHICYTVAIHIHERLNQ